MARKTLKEQLTDDRRELEEMEKAFAEKRRALKLKIEQKQKQYSSVYQKKRTHALCTVAPSAMYLMGRYEDNDTDTLDKIMTDFKTAANLASKEELELFRTTFDRIIARAGANNKQAESEKAENLPKCQNCGTVVSDAVVDYCNRHYGDKVLCMECQKAVQENK